MLLSIETSTGICSVCLSDNGKILIEESTSGYHHAEKLTVITEEVLKRKKLTFKNLNAVAVSAGPGSYTGLRIGVSVAKGLCYALNVPLIAISTLKAMTKELQHNNKQPQLFCPMIDAGRMEVYSAIYDEQLNEIQAVDARIITEDSFQDLLVSHSIIFFGNGAMKCKSLFLENTNALFSDFEISARGTAYLAEEKYRNKEFADLALFEPYYLKAANVGKKKMIS